MYDTQLRHPSADSRYAAPNHKQIRETDFPAVRKAKNSPSQRKTDPYGLPEHLKNGIENLSGFSMDQVRIHYNSSRPAQLQALAYTKGSEIHIAPGQEKHLPHEAWHVVQQMQGRVHPTMHLGNTAVNDDTSLEHEADVMGNAAMSRIQTTAPLQLKRINGELCVQKKNDLMCKATINYESGPDSPGEGFNNGTTASDVLNTFAGYGLQNLSTLRQAPGGNKPGVCAEPHAVADALRKRSPEETGTITKIEVSPAEFTPKCKNRIADRVLNNQALSKVPGAPSFARALLGGRDPVMGSQEDANLIRTSTATYPPCATCAQWIGSDGSVKDYYLERGSASESVGQSTSSTSSLARSTVRRNRQASISYKTTVHSAKPFPLVYRPAGSPPKPFPLVYKPAGSSSSSTPG